MKTIDINTLTLEEAVAAFTRWDREYREEPEQFMSTVQHLLKNTPETYGDAAARCFFAYVTTNRSEGPENAHNVPVFEAAP